MFSKALHARNPEPQAEKSARVTHTPGAYPPLAASRSESRPLEARVISSSTQAAQQASQTTNTAPQNSSTPESPMQQTPQDNPKEAGSCLIVGPDVKLKGAEIQDCDTLIVEGRVEATMDSRVIRIAAGGAFSGKVGIDVAEIHGQFEGELTARDRLVIHATGRVRGKIRYGSLLIEAGGQISGDVESLGEPHAVSSERGATIKSLSSAA